MSGLIDLTGQPLRRNTAHDAASRIDPRLAKWNPPGGSADADLLPELPTLRNRARDSARNNGLTFGIQQKLIDNTIGHQLRIRCTPNYRMLGKDRQWAKEWAQQTQDQFSTWAGTDDTISDEADAANHCNLRGLARQVLASIIQNGDALTLPIWETDRPGAAWFTRLQNIEADRLSTPPEYIADPMVRAGKRINPRGAALGYYIEKHHPGDAYGGITYNANREWEYVPAFTPWGRPRVIHLYRGESRIGASKDAPLLAPVLSNMTVLGSYLDHELHAAAANAIWAALLESNLDPDSAREIFGSEVRSARPGADGADSWVDYWTGIQEQWNGRDAKSFGGKILTVPMGAKFNGFSPNRPNVAFGPFTETVARLISAGTGLSYEMVFNDFSKSNYSNTRAALLECWRFFMSMRQWLIEDWLGLAYWIWLEEAVNRGKVEAPGFYENRAAWLSCRWLMAGRGYIDQTKEAQAQDMRLKNRSSTQEDECAEQGKDWREVEEQLALEEVARNEIRAAHGLPPLPSGGNASPQPPVVHASDVEAGQQQQGATA